MPSLSFALILSKNLGNPVLPLSQVESVIEIKGDPSPRELQRIRDLVSDSFQDRRKNINELITRGFKELAEARSEQSVRQIVNDFNADLSKAIASLDKEMQKRVTRIIEEDEELEAAASRGAWKYAFDTTWSVVKLSTDGVKLYKDIFSGGDLDLASAAGMLKSLFDLSRSAYGLATELRDACRSVETQQDVVGKALEKIKKTKKGAAVSLSDVKSAQDALETLGDKIDTIDDDADDLSRRVDGMLKLSVSKTFDDAEAAKTLEKVIGETLTSLDKLNKEIANRRKFEKSCESYLKDAAKKAKADTSYWVSWAATIYDLVNDLNDLRDDSDDLWDQANQIKTCVDKLSDLQEEAENDFENVQEARAELKKLLG